MCKCEHDCDCEDEDDPSVIIIELRRIRMLYADLLANGAGGGGVAGKSAYELAIQLGFVGTMTQWMDSLKGSPGAAGVAGVQGEDGDDGEQGEIGPAGPTSGHENEFQYIQPDNNGLLNL